MRTLLRFVFSAIGLLAAASLVPGIHRGTFLELLAVAVLLGALHATLGTLLKFLAFVPVALSLGCFSLVINGLVFWLAGLLSESLGLGFRVQGFWAGFFGALLSSFVAWLLEMTLLGRRRGPGPPPPVKILN
ncbi:MAG: phage holin family protein [Acidobacteria bacterium]|nr:phage holin family protein [Acidobacteriota bacterium]